MVAATSTVTELVIENVSAAYGRKKVLDNFSTARPIMGGHVTGLLGPNASGKSTLIRTLVGSNREIGYVPQEIPDTAALSALETVLVGARRAGAAEPVQAAASTLAELGVGHVAGRYLRELSGGQRQRVWIAMALAQRTDILLLDEPTTFLDVANQLEVLDLLMEINAERGITIVMVLHDLNLAARYSQQLIAMVSGSIYATGTPAEVITTATVKDVFGIESHIMPDPVSGAPMVMPKGRHHVNP